MDFHGPEGRFDGPKGKVDLVPLRRFSGYGRNRVSLRRSLMVDAC